MNKQEIVDLPSVVGSGYRDFWNFKGRYLAVKGGRGSKKSTTAALKIIYNMMKYPLSNSLVVRKYDVTHKDSTFAQLLWAIRRLKVEHLWQASRSPLMLTYVPTGQKILFRGLDDPQSITSITVDYGFLTYVWIEEAFQITKEADFDKLDLSIRGALPDGMWKQFILTFNPWNDKSWLKERFFDVDDEDTLALTTTYECNEFLGADDERIFETMKLKHPKRYKVEGLGEWGVADGLIYENWDVATFDYRSMLYETDYNGWDKYKQRYGIDFGFTVDPTAFIAMLVDETAKEVYVWDELYNYGLTNQEIYDMLKEKHLNKVVIKADSAEPRTINELQNLGLDRLRGAKKGPDSVRAGIQRLQDYRIIVHPTCENTINELSNYYWATDKAGKPLPRPADDGYDHLMDAMRYGTEDITTDNFSFATGGKEQ